ncbi:hypothetical protein Taro_004727 [Colocasia esculenta]|uniref:Uncharacterized protein n=1 Tax=Colocasia esculenta TaxID=4460 RepID=A0A843TJ21_COLES|nr:hypothetical protein [Colocasia esculenta]
MQPCACSLPSSPASISRHPPLPPAMLPEKTCSNIRDLRMLHSHLIRTGLAGDTRETERGSKGEGILWPSHGHTMGGHGGSSGRHHHHRLRLAGVGFPGGDCFAELDLLGGDSSPGISSCRCCYTHFCCSSCSEPELEDYAAGSGSVSEDDGGDGASSGDHGGGEGEGEACSYSPRRVGTRNKGNGTFPLRGEPSISADSARWGASGFTEVDVSRWRERRTYIELLRSYHGGGCGRLALLEEAKDAILRYTPGMWIERVGGTTPSNYRVPSTTTLLLVGPQGSGKSALVNRISRFLEDNPLLPDRAQVFHNIPTVEGAYSRPEYTVPRGTYFLQEYMIPRHSASFCVYDTWGLSKVASENLDILQRWMTKGVRHGEMVLRDNKVGSLKSKVKAMARNIKCSPFLRRKANFVIFVVDGISVLKTIYSLNKDYTNMLVEIFNYSFMSFKDNKPVVVVTHGDLLSFHERALVCTHLGELFGIPATKQIFDVPDLNCPMTNLAIVDLLRYCLEQADRNVPLAPYALEGTKLPQWMLKQFQDVEPWILILEIVFSFICALIFSRQLLEKLLQPS